jgi:hypothetical protein
MKPYAFPVTILVENEIGEVLYEQVCLNNPMLDRTYMKIKSFYNLEPDKSIIFKCNSKVNDKIRTIKVDYEDSDT